jgi:hypothetical protein
MPIPRGEDVKTVNQILAVEFNMGCAFLVQRDGEEFTFNIPYLACGVRNS